MSLLKSLEKINRAFWLKVLARVWPNKPLGARIDPLSVRRVLFVRYDGLGDMITTLPAIRLVKRLNPAIEVDVLASPRNVAVVRADRNVSLVHVLAPGLLSLIRTIRSARSRDYDVVISCVFGKTTKSGIISNAAAPRAVKATVLRGDRYRHLFSVQSQEAAERGSGWEKLAGIIEATFVCEVKEPDLDPYLAIGKDSSEAARRGLASLGMDGERFTVVNLSAFKPANRWTEDGFLAVIDALLEGSTGANVLMISVAEDASMAERLRMRCELRHPGRCRVYPATTDPMEIAAVIGRSELVITPDTGIVHVASAMQRPVVALYLGSTAGILEWGPHRVPHRIVHSGGDRVPVATITPAEVIAAVRDLQREIQRTAPV